MSENLRSVCLKAILLSARFLGIPSASHAEINVKYMIRDFPAQADEPVNRPQTIIQNQIYNVMAGRVIHSTPLSVDSAVVFEKSSPSFKWSVSGRMSQGKPQLDIMKGQKFHRRVELSEKHGDWCTDEFFGWVGWDESKNWFIYQAEANPPKPGKETFSWNPSFGETLSTRKDPRIFVLDLETGKIIYELAPSDEWTPSQIQYNPSEGSVYFVGYEKLSRKYGLAFCINRPTSLYRWDILTAAIIRLTSSEQVEVVYYPVLSGEDKLRFFGTSAGGSHFRSLDYYEIDLKSGELRKILDAEACGIFIDENNQPTIAEDGSLFAVSYQGTERALFRFKGDSLSQIHAPDEFGMQVSWQLHQVLGKYLLASVSSRSMRPTLMLVTVEGESVSWKQIEQQETTIHGIEQAVYNVAEYIDIVLAKPTELSAKELPLIIFPHGGPNHSYNTEFSLFVEVAVTHGYAVATINYSGSSGYGQAGIRRLEGKVGSLDVDDCIEATRYLVESVGFSQDNLHLYGGSHGGFLVAHLSCRPEFKFRACVAVNAVIDYPSVSVTSDTVDFAFGQLGLFHDIRHPLPPTLTDLQLMYEASPSSRIASVPTEHLPPTLIMIGEDDLRVPPTQGKVWYTWLRAKGVHAEIYYIPGTGHALSSPEGTYQLLVKTFQFLAKFQSTSQHQ